MTCKWIRVKWTTQVPTEVVIVEQRIFYLTAWRLEMRTGSCAFSPMVISGWPSLVLNEPHLDQFDQNTGPFGITFKIAYVVEETVYVPYILKLNEGVNNFFGPLLLSKKVVRPWDSPKRLQGRKTVGNHLFKTATLRFETPVSERRREEERENCGSLNKSFPFLSVMCDLSLESVDKPTILEPHDWKNVIV